MAVSAFYLRKEKDDEKKILEDKDLEVLGSPIIKYGDSTVIVQHVETGLWLSYKVFNCSLQICYWRSIIHFFLLSFRLMRQKRKASARLKKNKPFCTKKEKWTTASSSVEAKKKSLALLELSENAVLSLTDSSRTKPNNFRFF